VLAPDVIVDRDGHPDDARGPRLRSPHSSMTFLLRPAARCETSVGSGHLPRGESRYSSGGRAHGRSAGAAARGAGGRLARLDGAPRHDAAAPSRSGDLHPAGLGLRGRGDGHVQDTVGVAGGEVLRIRALAEGQLPGERPLGPLGGNDLLAVAVVRGSNA